MCVCVCTQTDTDGVAAETAEPEHVCVHNSAPREHFAMGTVVMRTQDNFAVDGKRPDRLCGRSPLLESVGVRADHAAGGLRRGSAHLKLSVCIHMSVFAHKSR